MKIFHVLNRSGGIMAGGIAIQLPPMNAEDTVEIEVRVNGKKQTYKYRVELLDWNDCEEPPEIRIECLKRVIDDYNNGWQLVHIGAPTDNNVPIMFRKKEKDEA